LTDTFPPYDSRLPTRTRYVVITAICMAAVVAYMGRNCLGVASESVQADLGIGIGQMAWVMSAFFWAYALAQVPAGWLAHRFGTRLTLACYATAWSVLCAGFYLVGDIWALLALQAGFGLAQAGIFPCSAGMIRHWMPSTHWALSVGLMGGFMSIGGAVGSAITGYAIEGVSTSWLSTPPVSWRWVFVGFSIPGFVFAAWFYSWYRDRPEMHSKVNQAERDLIRSSSPQQSRAPSGTSWLLVAGQPAMLLLYGQQFCRAAGYIFFPTWFPEYLRQTRGVSTGESGLLTALPLLAVVAGSMLGGALVDWLWRRTGSLRISRQYTAVAALAACAACIGAAYFVSNVYGAVCLISMGTFCGTLAGPPASATTIDKAGDHTEQIYGMMNMTGNLGAAACPLAIGFLVEETGNWNLVLLVFVGIYATAALCWVFLDPRGQVATEQHVA
jgi:ACS family D-galactonate transporter-like MFS transporter